MGTSVINMLAYPNLTSHSAPDEQAYYQLSTNMYMKYITTIVYSNTRHTHNVHEVCTHIHIVHEVCTHIHTMYMKCVHTYTLYMKCVHAYTLYVKSVRHLPLCERPEAHLDNKTDTILPSARQDPGMLSP